jgi:hypothetical protein
MDVAQQRVDLEGALIGDDVNAYMHDRTLLHHETAPGQPGYTLKELCELGRSAVHTQRILALCAIRGALFRRAVSLLPPLYPHRVSQNESATKTVSQLPLELPTCILENLKRPAPVRVRVEAVSALCALLGAGTEERAVCVGMTDYLSHLSLFAPPHVCNSQARPHKCMRFR